jgi:hypothetical protein
VTHPFHPLCGRELSLVTYRHNWRERRVYFHDEQGRLTSLPVSWTVLGQRVLPTEAMDDEIPHDEYGKDQDKAIM